MEKTKPEPQYSVAPITKPSNSDIRFAQSALKKLAYKIGAVDGIWGKRSAKALIAFEAENSLWSADGSLSDMNLHTLGLKTGLTRSSFRKAKSTASKGIGMLLNKRVLLENGPQLIILERNYIVMSKPNPYSSKLLTLSPDTAIYVIGRQDKWYQIETLERQTGFVRVD